MHSRPNQIKHHQAKQQESRIRRAIAIQGELGRAKARPQTSAHPLPQQPRPLFRHTPTHIDSRKGGYPNSHLNGSMSMWPRRFG